MNKSSRVAVDNSCANPLLEAFAKQYADYLLEPDESNIELLIQSTPQGLQWQWRSERYKKALLFAIDIDTFIHQQKTFPASKQGAFNQALGKSSRHIIDATGGFAGDALLMCAQGYQLTIIERDALMAMLLKDAMQRLSFSEWAKRHQITVPQVIEANSIDYLSNAETTADCVYLDPMFPDKRKKSAVANKNMQFLQWWVGADNDAEQLLDSALQGGYRRVAVKRPDYATPLAAERVVVDVQFSSKLIHYDVYLNSLSK